jgi:hypothetical protein
MPVLETGATRELAHFLTQRNHIKVQSSVDKKKEVQMIVYCEHFTLFLQYLHSF